MSTNNSSLEQRRIWRVVESANPLLEIVHCQIGRGSSSPSPLSADSHWLLEGRKFYKKFRVFFESVGDDV